MANNIFQLKTIRIDSDYIWPVLNNPAVNKVFFIGEKDGYGYFSYNPEEMTITEGQGNYDVRILDKNNEADAATLTYLKQNSQFVKQTISEIEQKILNKYTTVALNSGIATNNATVLQDLSNNVSEKEAALLNLGF